MPTSNTTRTPAYQHFHSGARDRRLASMAGWTLVFAAGAIILCVAALANGEPILFPDTLSYLLDGEQLIRLSWPGNERPVFYGLAIWFLHWERTIWPVLFAQGLVMTHLLWLTLRTLGAPSRRFVLLGLVAGLAAVTPLSWYVSHVMPDVFTGVLVLAMFLLGVCRQRIGRGETIYLFLLATAAICFHLSHLPLALTLASAGLLAWLVPRWRPTLRPALLTGPILLALATFFSFSLVVYREVTLTPKSPPFLLARVLADGPGRAYLRVTCAHTPFPYVLCRELDRLPDTENGFLWGMLAPIRTTPEFWAIRAEQGPIVAGTFRMFPGWTAWTMLRNTARQLITIDSATEFGPHDRLTLLQHYHFVAPNYDQSLQGRGLLDDPHLLWINRIHAGAALAGLLVAVLLAWMCWRRGAVLPVVLLSVVLLSLVVNAFVTGALSGVFGRYQGRIIWLLPFCAVAFALLLTNLPCVWQRQEPTGTS